MSRPAAGEVRSEVTVDLAALSSLAARAARAGGDVAADRFRSSDLEVTDKGGLLNVVTDADVASQEAILAVLAERPQDAVLAEEDHQVDGVTGVGWYVDPIDSTSNFSRGLPGWSVSVGATVDGVPAAGAVCDPLSGETLRAHVGGPVLSNDRPVVSPPAAETVDDATVYLCTHRGNRRAPLLAGAWFAKAARVRCPGSPALALAHTAAGRYDICVIETLVNPWDITAGLALCAAAGRHIHRVRRPNGTPLIIVAAGEQLLADAVLING